MSAIALLFVMLLAACAQLPWKPLLATVPPALDGEPAFSTPLYAQSPTQISPSASWMEVDLAKQAVILHESGLVIAQYKASTGVMNDPQYETPPGLYRVQSKEKGSVESVPGVFVSDIIMFDVQNGNGIHSRPMDANGNILDARLGQPTTAGCVRVEESASVFEFAQMGMWVWIH